MPITFTIAGRYILRRKIRMGIIGLLVFLGTMVIVCGEIFSRSAKHSSRQSIIRYFTGDLTLYSSRSKDKPSPFSFTTPLPVISRSQEIESWLAQNPLVAHHVAIAQNYGLLSIVKNDRKTEVPFFFYAVDPINYAKTFPNISMRQGAFYNQNPGGPETGVVLSAFQRDNYASNYSVDMETGDPVTLLSLTQGGSVNAYPSKIIGIYEPRYYTNVFNYINFLDVTSYSRLYNFTGVDTASLPSSFNKALGTKSEDDIFGLADQDDFSGLDTKTLKTQELNGYTQIAVKLIDFNQSGRFIRELESRGFDIKVSDWKESSGFFADVATVIQSIIYAATFLIFLIVVFILMNTLIISVLERTNEIGTLRALGGEKSFISSIFFWESLMVNGSAAALGMAASLVLALAVRAAGGVPLPDVLAQYLIGGGTLPLQLSVRPFIEAFALVLAVSFLATIYPVRVAAAVSPLKAMAEK